MKQNILNSKIDISVIKYHFPDLFLGEANYNNGTVIFRLNLPSFPSGREFSWGELHLPKFFPNSDYAFIKISPDAILRIPHVEYNGKLCINGDPGPSSGCCPEDRVILLLNAYQEQFLKPWLNGELDNNFISETMNYWAIKVDREKTIYDPVKSVWLVDLPPVRANIRTGVLLLPSRIMIVGDNKIPFSGRLVHSLGENAKQIINVRVADIPISYPLTPSTWPNTCVDIEYILKGHLHPSDCALFGSASDGKKHSIHRIVLLRNKTFSYAYLLPNGPRSVGGEKKRENHTNFLNKPQALPTNRLDPLWTVGRDQNDKVESRQKRHILVFGAGALGSSIVDYLAKSGIGFITLVDDDVIVPANIGRHLLGADSIGSNKANAVAKRVNHGHPATVVNPQAMTAEQWLKKHDFSKFDIVIDLTGEPDVRWNIENERTKNSLPLLIGWMEPYVAAAHACLLPAKTDWFRQARDPMAELNAVNWPEDVILSEPGCSTRFQSYTSVSAAYAVALIAEGILDLVDAGRNFEHGEVRSWVRGKAYLDKQRKGLSVRNWASSALQYDGLVITRPFS